MNLSASWRTRLICLIDGPNAPVEHRALSKRVGPIVSLSAPCRVLALAVILALTAVSSAGCSPSVDGGPFTPVPIHPFFEDAVLGDAKAPVTIIEYASTTCHGCYQLHTTLMPEIKASFIDTGKVKLIYRVMPTPPADISEAGAAVARCAGKDKFHDVIADLFANQPKILKTAAIGGAQSELLRIGMRHGLSREEVRTCIADKAIQAYTLKVAQAAPPYVSHTPSLIVNGDYIEHNSRETIFAMIEEKLAAAPPVAATAPAPNP